MRALVALGGIVVLVAACGSTPPPTDSPSSSPIASTTPISSSPASANPSSSAAVSYTVKLPPSGGQKMRVLVHDPGGVLAGARVPTAAEAADVENAPTGDEAALIEGRTGKMLVASWFGTSCDKKVDVTVVGRRS